MDEVRGLDLSPRQTTPVPGVQDLPDNRRAVEYFAPGGASGGFAAEGAAGAGAGGAAADGDGYDLNFENAPVTTVAKVVLGDILGQPYVIDPKVQGNISLSSARAVPKGDLLYVLETALKANGVALVRDAAGYRLVPVGDAAGSGRVDVGAGRPEAGYGLSVVPLRYVSAATLMPLLDSFALQAGAVRADPGRNALLIQGTAAERAQAVRTALSFDADWMRGQSVGIYPVRNSAPEALVPELESILDTGENGLSHALVKFQPINRLNAIMVVAKKPELLKAAATWIERLDRSDTTVGVRVYRLRYGDARQTARVLNDLFLGSGGSGGLDQAASQVAPGSGLAASAGGGLGSGGAGSSSGGQGLSVQQRLGAAPATPAGGASPGGASSGGASSGGGDGEDEGAAGGARGSAAGPGPGAGMGGGPGSGVGAGGAVLPGVRITADTVNNSLLIFASQENYRIIERTLMQLDQPQLQVAIEATVAEVTLNDTLAYGVQFYLTSKDLGLGRNNGSALNTLSDTVTDQAINRVLPGFNLLVGRENQPRMILDALHTVTDVKVLSNPSLVVVDNQPATLQVGDEVPVSTGSATVLSSSNTVVNTIEYKNTGIILHVVPRVNVNGQVRLDIEQEISNVTPVDSGGGAASSTLTPTVSQRKVKSTIAVASGQTVLLAGLISERSGGVRQGIPGLDQVPVLGDAAGHTKNTVQRTELIIFIRPQIIRDNVDAHTVAEELRAKLKGTVGTLPGGPQPLINR
ncbi:type II secretion system secretin GspD [Xanthobacter sediminis]